MFISTLVFVVMLWLSESCFLSPILDNLVIRG
jgi:hypothetical protein